MMAFQILVAALVVIGETDALWSGGKCEICSGTAVCSIWEGSVPPPALAMPNVPQLGDTRFLRFQIFPAATDVEAIIADPTILNGRAPLHIIQVEEKETTTSGSSNGGCNVLINDKSCQSCSVCDKGTYTVDCTNVINGIALTCDTHTILFPLNGNSMILPGMVVPTVFNPPVVSKPSQPVVSTIAGTALILGGGSSPSPVASPRVFFSIRPTLNPLSGGGITIPTPTTVMRPSTRAPTMTLSTNAPFTLTPITLAPITQAPITMAPITMAPITLAPITLPPTTIAPATLTPTTIAPVTLAPTTISPATASPSTREPTIMKMTPSTSPTGHPTGSPFAVTLTTSSSIDDKKNTTTTSVPSAAPMVTSGSSAATTVLSIVLLVFIPPAVMWRAWF